MVGLVTAGFWRVKSCEKDKTTEPNTEQVILYRKDAAEMWKISYALTDSRVAHTGPEMWVRTQLRMHIYFTSSFLYVVVLSKQRFCNELQPDQ
jgi:hypothetical protein